MLVKITYEYDPKWGGLAYWAKAEGVSRCGVSFENAKERLLETLRTMDPAPTVPPSEEVEI